MLHPPMAARGRGGRGLRSIAGCLTFGLCRMCLSRLDRVCCPQATPNTSSKCFVSKIGGVVGKEPRYIASTNMCRVQSCRPSRGSAQQHDHHGVMLMRACRRGSPGVMVRVQRSCNTRRYSRSKYHTQVAEIIFDETLDLTVVFCFLFRFLSSVFRASGKQPGWFASAML